MIVKDLIKELQKHDENAIIVLSCDSEGNSYSPLLSIQDSNYQEESSCQGDLTDNEASPLAVVFYPTL